MRAKERNLQALKDNYEKMQEAIKLVEQKQAIVNEMYEFWEGIEEKLNN